MAQIFHPSFNTIAKVSIFGALFAVAGGLFIAAEIHRSPYITQAFVPRVQPVPFSHEHHVAGLGLDCRYCHTTVETSGSAGMPSTKTCMTCHSQIWTSAALLEPVRQSWRDGRPIPWVRVHDLPDFVHFNHSVHIQKGVGCASCHGRVDEMPLTWQTASLQMEWCLSCHRAPERFVRPRDQVFSLAYTPAAGQVETGRELVARYDIHTQQMSNCSVCHY
jgi:hypothetical protein